MKPKDPSEKSKPEDASGESVQYNPFKELIEGIRVLDDIGTNKGPGNSYVPLSERIDIRFELYWISGEIITTIYETGHRDKADIVKPRVGNVKNWDLSNVTSLDDFVKDYEEQLEHVRIRYEPKVINLGQGEGVLHQQTYSGMPHELFREIDDLLNFMVRQYSS